MTFVACVFSSSSSERIVQRSVHKRFLHLICSCFSFVFEVFILKLFSDLLAATQWLRVSLPAFLPLFPRRFPIRQQPFVPGQKHPRAGIKEVQYDMVKNLSILRANTVQNITPAFGHFWPGTSYVWSSTQCVVSLVQCPLHRPPTIRAPTRPIT